MSSRQVVNNYQFKKLNKQFKIFDKRLICLVRKERNYAILHNSFAGSNHSYEVCETNFKSYRC
jgi:hypothetical protein